MAVVRKAGMWFPHSSTFVSVAALRVVESFVGNLDIAQDYLISLKVLSRFGPPLVLDEVLSHFQLGGLSSRKTVKTGLEAIRARVMVFGLSQAPRKRWNLVRVLVGRPLKKVFSKRPR